MSDKPKLPHVQLFGERILFQHVEEEVGGSLVLPERANKMYELGKVLKVGDGKVKDKDGKVTEKKIVVNIGDTVWFQMMPMMAQNCAIRFNGQTYLQVHQNDIIGRLKKPKVTFENFEVIGQWVLLDTFEDKRPDSIIQLPDAVDDPNLRVLRYFVLQKGAQVEGIEVGQEIVIEKRAATLVALNDVPVFYIHANNILGTVENTPELEKAKEESAEKIAKAEKEAAEVAKHKKAHHDSLITPARR